MFRMKTLSKLFSRNRSSQVSSSTPPAHTANTSSAQGHYQQPSPISQGHHHQQFSGMPNTSRRSMQAPRRPGSPDGPTASLQRGNRYRTLGVVGMPGREDVRPMRPELLDSYRVTADPYGRLMRGGALLSTNSQDGDTFVMDGQGRLFASDLGHNHQSYLGSLPVAAAGHIQATNGVLESIDNNSGHYQLPPAVGHQVVDHLQSQGVVVPPSADRFFQAPDQVRTRAYPDPSTHSWTTAARVEGHDSERPQPMPWNEGDVLDIR